MAKYYYSDNAFEDPDYDESYTGNYMKFDRNWYWKVYKNSKHVWTLNLPPVAPIMDENWNRYRDMYLRDHSFTYGYETFKTQDLRLHVNYCFTYKNSQEETGMSPYTRSEAVGNIYVNYPNYTYNVEPGIQYRIYAPVDATNMYRYVRGQDYNNLFFHSAGFENGVNNFTFLRYTHDANNMFCWTNIDWGDQAWFAKKYCYNYQTLEYANNMFKGANINIDENVWIPFGLKCGEQMFEDVNWTGAETANSGLVFTSRIENCYRLYYGCNFITNFTDERYLPTTRDYSGMFCKAKNLQYVNFNTPLENVIVPNHANNCAFMYNGTNLRMRNVTIESSEVDNVYSMLANLVDRDYSDIIDIWLPGWETWEPGFTTTTNDTIYKSRTEYTSITGTQITWKSSIKGYYYNLDYGIRVHYGTKAAIAAIELPLSVIKSYREHTYGLRRI